jgi:hypothetical protein
MRPSQIAMLSAAGVVVAVMLSTASWIALSAELEPEGAGNEQLTRTLALAGFTGVEVNGNWDVTIERGDTAAVELSYPSGFENRATAQVENGRLVIGGYTSGFKGGFWNRLDDGRNSRRWTVRVTMPSLDTLEVSGASSIAFSGFEGSKLAAHVSGAADVRGREGRYRDLDVSLSGAGSLDFRDVVATNAKVALSGVGSIRLRVDGGVLTGNASGAGSIEYSGTVSMEQINKSGFVSVRHRN